MLQLGSDRFELVREVGAGSYGVVYEARDRQSGDSVAIKVLQTGDDLAEERFERETRVLAELRHPAIVRYVAHGTAENGRRYLVMEWLSGRTLESHLRRGRCTIDDVLTLARRVVGGLLFAEQRGIAHRDIKPANLFLVDGLVSGIKILDFGLARPTSDRQNLTHTGFIVGTPRYMSPEQARGDPSIDTRTDVFSLGSVLYECLCGEPPFKGAQHLATLAKICFDEPQPIEQLSPHVPARLRSLVHAMLHKKREDRPALRTIAQELAAIAEDAAAAKAELVRLSTPDDGSVTMDLSLTERALVRREAPSLNRRGHRGDHRILAAVFVGDVGTLANDLEAELNAVVARHSARVERLLDGSRLVLPEQQLGTSEQAVVAARCALSLRRLLIGRGGLVVCTGRAVIDDVQPLGALFERGASLLAAAAPGTVRVDEASAALLGGRFELGGDEDSGRTLDRERRGGEAPRTVLGQPSAFVGREREVRQLELIFGECVEEQVTRACLVTAPPGAGKSRLLHELVERLRASCTEFTLLMGRGDAMRVGTQFGVIAFAVQTWAEMSSGDSAEVRRIKLTSHLSKLVTAQRLQPLSEFLGEMSGVPFPDQNSPQLRAARSDHQLMADRMLAAWLEWLEALGQEPILFCLEDLHWSDPASLRFLEAAMRNARQRGLMVLAFARPEVRELFPRLWSEREMTEIRLPKLGSRSCARLLDALLAEELSSELRDAMIERADGNPFFLEELVRAFKSSDRSAVLPDSILAIVQARLDALGEEPRLLMRAASVFGQSFRLAGLRALFGEEAAQLDFETSLALLCEREVIFPRGASAEPEYVFRHALIRDAAYMLLRDEDRALGHRLAAGWLERNGEDPAVLADHYERGEMRPNAAHWYPRAAAQAFEAGSLDQVLRFGERAIACGVEGEALSRLAALLAEAHSYRDDHAGAVAWAERARTNLAPGTPDWWRATWTGAVASLCMGRREELDALAAEMIASFRADVALPEQALAIAYLFGECLRLMRDDLGQRLLPLLPRELPEALRGRPEGCLNAARAIAAFRDGNLSEALRLGLVALDVHRRAGAIRDVCDTAGLCGYMLHELGMYEEGKRYLLEQVQLGDRIGSKRDVAYAKLNLGSIYARQGLLDEAECALREACAGHDSLGASSFKGEGLGHLAGVLIARGDLDGASEAVERGLQQLETMELAAQAYVLARASSVRFLRGQTGAALEHAQRARALVHANALTEFAALIELAFIDAALAAGRRDIAGEALAETARWLEAQAAKIADPALRASFLENVAEHARVRALASDPTCGADGDAVRVDR